jgi:ABC-type nitrate/sulfonate/bicarbonate transport system substrate-binding protein
VPTDSPIKSVAELKGKQIAMAKGSNANYLLTKLLPQAGLKFGDIEVIYLPPADARAAFASGRVDAWLPRASAREGSASGRSDLFHGRWGARPLGVP